MKRFLVFIFLFLNCFLFAGSGFFNYDYFSSKGGEIQGKIILTKQNYNGLEISFDQVYGASLLLRTTGYLVDNEPTPIGIMLNNYIDKNFLVFAYSPISTTTIFALIEDLDFDKPVRGDFLLFGDVNISFDLFVNGNLSVNGTKSFDIEHPNPQKASQGYRLRHYSVESNDSLIMYRGIGIINDNQYIINLPEYFKFLREEGSETCHITSYDNNKNIYIYYEDYKNNKVIIKGENGAKFSWIILANRKGCEKTNEYIEQPKKFNIIK